MARVIVLVIVSIGGACIHFGDDILKGLRRITPDFLQATSRQAEEVPWQRSRVYASPGDSRRFSQRTSATELNEAREIPAPNFRPAQIRYRTIGTQGRELPLSDWVEKPRVLAIVPSGNQRDATAYRNVFGKNKTLSPFMSKKLNRMTDLFNTLSNTSVASHESFGIDALFGFIQESGDSNTIVVVGHSIATENGKRILKLPDGSDVDVDGLRLAAAANGKSCLVMTCFGRDFGFKTEISLESAYHMVAKSLEQYSRCRDSFERVTHKEFVDFALDEQARQEFENVALWTIGVVATGDVVFSEYFEENSR